MKKIILSLALCASAAVAYAAYDVTRFASVDVLAPTAITAGSTNVTEFAVRGLKGKCAVEFVATPAVGRSVEAWLYATNTVSGGWTLYSTASVTATNAVAFSMPFVGEYVTERLMLKVCPKANTTLGAFILGAK